MVAPTLTPGQFADISSAADLCRNPSVGDDMKRESIAFVERQIGSVCDYLRQQMERLRLLEARVTATPGDEKAAAEAAVLRHALFSCGREYTATIKTLWGVMDAVRDHPAYPTISQRVDEFQRIGLEIVRMLPKSRADARAMDRPQLTPAEEDAIHRYDDLQRAKTAGPPALTAGGLTTTALLAVGTPFAVAGLVGVVMYVAVALFLSSVLRRASL